MNRESEKCKTRSCSKNGEVLKWGVGGTHHEEMRKAYQVTPSHHLEKLSTTRQQNKSCQVTIRLTQIRVDITIKVKF